MEKPKIIPKGCFWSEENQKLYMVRCPKCGKENYAPAVASGTCAWCGYDVNKKEVQNAKNSDEI